MILEPLGDIAYMVRVMVIQVLPRREQLHGADPRLQDPVEGMGPEPLIDKHVSRYAEVHQYPAAFPSPRGSTPPNRQPVSGSISIASHSPILSRVAIV